MRKVLLREEHVVPLQAEANLRMHGNIGPEVCMSLNRHSEEKARLFNKLNQPYAHLSTN